MDRDSPDDTAPAPVVIRRQDAVTQASLARLAILPGFKLARGLDLLPGKPEKYLKLLGRFVEAHLDDMTRLSACMANGDHATARNIAHTLKGTAATLGADSIATQAAKLEIAANEGRNGVLPGDDMCNEIEIIGREFAALAAALPRTEPGTMT